MNQRLYKAQRVPAEASLPELAEGLCQMQSFFIAHTRKPLSAPLPCHFLVCNQEVCILSSHLIKDNSLHLQSYKDQCGRICEAACKQDVPGPVLVMTSALRSDITFCSLRLCSRLGSGTQLGEQLFAQKM